MKAKYGLVILLVTVLVLVAGGGEALAAGGDKTTGGGWFINEAFGELSGHRITFGFNARHTGDGSAEGEFQLVDHDSNTTIHGTFATVEGEGSDSVYWGTCSIDREGSYTLSVWPVDGGEPGIGSDDIWITIFGISNGVPLIYWYWGDLGGGNIQVHE